MDSSHAYAIFRAVPRPSLQPRAYIVRSRSKLKVPIGDLMRRWDGDREVLTPVTASPQRQRWVPFARSDRKAARISTAPALGRTESGSAPSTRSRVPIPKSLSLLDLAQARSHVMPPPGEGMHGAGASSRRGQECRVQGQLLGRIAVLASYRELLLYS